ncbi:hexokinase [Treponema rectale]|uniref:Hexokinase n=1 Tax=Treponema rectale TaxID=744512 RepID=A0A840SBL1_9SPIR|nr:hexokinase [Treponema rectale]MBB5218214.1 hexokinase [Treponema rectale]QOS40082.1 hexokinase [Treponema rectale]
MNRAAQAFLGAHNFQHHIDINTVAESILYDMHEGLCRRPAGQDMILTYSNPPEHSPVNKTVIVIDAGGTNFRSCLVTFDAEGNPSISEMEKTKMPGVERELSKKEFFDQFAANLEHLKDKANHIGFCFSYPMTITEDGDGVLIGFAKEVKAPEVNGCHVGAELKKVLKEHGWKNNLDVVLMNDTVSALLAGAAGCASGKKYSSYVGFILGTGMNGAYIQSECDCYPGVKKQIVVCESGKFIKLPSSDFDRAFDAKSQKPGTSILEKQCSGAYFGPVSYEMLMCAAKEGLFSENFAKKLLSLENLTLIEVDKFLHGPYSDSCVLGKIASESATPQDYEILFDLLDAVAERCARLAAAILTACVVKSGKGTSSIEPVCLLCNGTTFFKTYKVYDRVKGYLEEVLVKQRNLYFEIVEKDNDITFGTAIGAFRQ